MKRLIIIPALALLLSSCSDDSTTNVVTPTTKTFKVLVENRSMAGTLPVPRLDGTAPLSHGVYAVFTGNDPTFTPGQPANEGTQRIAEDGFTTVMTNMLNNTAGVMDHGEFVAPGGPDMGAALFVGESSMFMVEAKPGDKLQIQSMFVQSGDWFYSFGDGGVPLFNGSTPVSGDMTSKLVLYDAGSEMDDPPGAGPNQKPAQDPLAMNVGPDDAVNTIQVVPQRHTGFTIPATNSVIRVTITPQ
jgi:hypothetical protein